MKSIKETNKLIVEFMGYSVYPEKGDKDFNNWKGKACDYHHSELLYKTSWDWIMPVVEKIETLGYDVEIESNNCDITGENFDYSYWGENKINAVYNAIVGFISHYNTNPS